MGKIGEVLLKSDNTEITYLCKNNKYCRAYGLNLYFYYKNTEYNTRKSVHELCDYIKSSRYMPSLHNGKV